MEGLFDEHVKGPRFLTVSQVTQKIKGLLELEVGEVWVKGEISSFKPSSAGHLYFNLKDEGSVLSCAFFRGSASRTKFEMKDGLEVIVHGKISVYSPRGNYQLIIDHVEPVGAGALQLAFEQLKKKLLGEGLFANERKKPFPPYPNKVAIVTSSTGAALQDMLNVLGRRNAGISIMVIPTLVQGEQAPEQIVKAIQIANKYDLGDVLIIARGGGSLEDLWCFNDERVVRAIAASKIPTISAIGHEVDFTLSDFAADLRAPTPSAAAELVCKNKTELIEGLQSGLKRLELTVAARIAVFKSRLMFLEKKIINPGERILRFRKTLSELEIRLFHSIESMIPQYRQMIDESQMRIQSSCERILTGKKHRLDSTALRLEALSPLKVLGRGYTLIEDTSSGKLLKSKQDVKSGQDVEIIFQDGKAKAKWT